MRPAWMTVALALAPRAEAAVDAFVCIEDVTGTCDGTTTADFTMKNGWFPVNAVALGAANLAPESDRQGAGPAVLRPVEIVAPVGPATPLAVQATLTGIRPPKATIAWARAGGAKATAAYLEAELISPVLQTNLLQVAGVDPPTWRLAIAADEIAIHYAKQKSDGTLLSPTTTTWKVTP